MVSFLAESLETLRRSLCARFITKDALKSAKIASLLIELDVADKTNQKDINSVDLGFGLKYELKRLVSDRRSLACKFFNLKEKRWSFWQVRNHAMEKKSIPIFVCKVPEMLVFKLHSGILKILRADV